MGQNLHIGTGYPGSGSSFTSNGDVKTKGDLNVDGTVDVKGTLTVKGDIVAQTAGNKNLFTTNSNTITIGHTSGTVELKGTVKINQGYGVANGVTIESNGDIKTNGILTIAGNITSSADTNREIFANVGSDKLHNNWRGNEHGENLQI